MQVLRLIDLRLSRLPGAVGMQENDLPGLAKIVNAAESRLLLAKEQSDEGWWGTWAELVFNVQRSSPFITCPRNVARLEMIDVCRTPVPVNNSFYEYLLFGDGRLPKNSQRCGRVRLWDTTQAMARNNACTFVDLDNQPQLIAVYPVSAADVGKRVLVEGYDKNYNRITTMDGGNLVQGEFITIAQPFAVSLNEFTAPLLAIQKDATQGQVQIFQQDPFWGTQELLVTMDPSEQTASYRRYYLDHLPGGCCPGPAYPLLHACGCQNFGSPPSGCGCPCGEPADNALVTALAKLDHVPVVADTDRLVIQCKEAVIEECIAVRFSEMDSAASTQKAAEHHLNAIRLLIGESSHYNGKNQIAIGFKPFGRRGLERAAINMT